MGYKELPAAYSQPREHVKSTTDIDQIIVSIQTLYISSLCTIKLSILLFYDRVFGVPRPMFRYILLAMGGVVIAYSVAGMLGTVLQWKPLSDLWYMRFGIIPSCLVANLGYTAPFYSQFGGFSPRSVSNLGPQDKELKQKSTPPPKTVSLTQCFGP